MCLTSHRCLSAFWVGCSGTPQLWWSVSQPATNKNKNLFSHIFLLIKEQSLMPVFLLLDWTTHLSCARSIWAKVIYFSTPHKLDKQLVHRKRNRGCSLLIYVILFIFVDMCPLSHHWLKVEFGQPYIQFCHYSIGFYYYNRLRFKRIELLFLLQEEIWEEFYLFSKWPNSVITIKVQEKQEIAF